MISIKVRKSELTLKLIITSPPVLAYFVLFSKVFGNYLTNLDSPWNSSQANRFFLDYVRRRENKDPSNIVLILP